MESVSYKLGKELTIRYNFLVVKEKIVWKRKK